MTTVENIAQSLIRSCDGYTLGISGFRNSYEPVVGNKLLPKQFNPHATARFNRVANKQCRLINNKIDSESKLVANSSWLAAQKIKNRTPAAARLYRVDSTNLRFEIKNRTEITDTLVARGSQLTAQKIKTAIFFSSSADGGVGEALVANKLKQSDAYET